MTTASGALDLPSVSLHYETRGAGPLLVLIPGNPGTGAMLADLAHHLASYYTVATYDRRGCGQSHIKAEANPSPEGIFTIHARDTISLIAHLSPHDQAAIFATSSGVLVALELLRLAPQLVRSAVLHEPVLATLLPPSAHLEIQQWGLAVQGAFQNRGTNAAARLFLPMVIDKKERYLMRSMAQDQANQATKGDMGFFFEHEIEAVSKFEFRPDTLAKSGIYIHLVRGADSSLGFPTLPVNAMAEMLGLRVSLIPGGHVGYLTHAEGFAREMVTLLRSERGRL